jgi:hypothetical protein
MYLLYKCLLPGIPSINLFEYWLNCILQAVRWYTNCLTLIFTNRNFNEFLCTVGDFTEISSSQCLMNIKCT